ncbi:MAG: ATP-binding protein [Myxococcota bacterium]
MGGRVGPDDGDDWARVAAAHVDAGVVVHAADTALLWANEKASELLGISRDDLTGKLAVDPDFRLLDPSGDLLPIDEYPVVRVTQDPGTPLRDVVVGALRPDGESAVWCRLSAVPLFDEAGGLARIVVTFVDITALRAAEAQRLEAQAALQEAARLEGLAVLAGGVAHDFNNLLVGMLGAAETLRETTADPDDQELLEVCVESAHRAAELTRQLMAYAGRTQLVLETVDPKALVRDLTRMVRGSLEGRAELTVALADDTPAITVDATQLRQVLLNLVLNAADAVEAGTGARVAVETGSAELDAEELERAAPEQQLDPGRYAIFRVRDDGIGMDETTRARVFEPFYTTKETGHGLGLAAVLGMVRGHRGFVRVASAPGRGTTFEVALPATQASPASASLRAGSGPTPRAGARVLVVDDEPQVRTVLKRVLEGLGFAVELHADGTGLAGALDADVAAVFLDVTLPGRSGTVLLGELRAAHPALPVVLMSGHVDVEDRVLLPPEDPTRLLEKPFRIESVRRVLAELTGG